jgi:hypothetical protein
MKQLFAFALCSLIPQLLFAGSFFIKSFDVYYANKTVAITWETGFDAQNGNFVIERSNDAINFEELIKVKADETTADISFLEIDQAPLSGTSYYRIKQTTKEGLVIYSSIRTLKSYDALAMEMNLVPDPCDKNFKDELGSYSEEEILVVLRDKVGNEYYSKINLINDECTIEAVQKGEELPAGEYVVTASSKNELYTQSIVIK